jgi:hypothetical protein
MYFRAEYLIQSKLLTLLSNIRSGMKYLPGTNTLAYFASSSGKNKKSFITLILGKIIQHEDLI